MKWLVAALLLLALALVFQMGLLAYAMYALLGVLIGSRYLAKTWVRSLKAERRISRTTAEIGDTVAVSIAATNASNLPIAWALLEDTLPPRALVHNPPALEVRGKRLELAMYRPRQRRTLLYQMTCHRRGYYQIGPLVMETGDLFGLHRKFRILTEPEFLLVYPKVVPLEGYEIASRRPIGEVQMTHRLFEDPTRIAGVREYQAGDPLNRVHWKATARTGSLHSKIYEPSTLSGATVLLDMHRGAYDRANEPVRSDLAVTAAASIANTVYEMGQQIGFVTNGRDAADRIRVEGYRLPPATRKAARQRATAESHNDRLRPVFHAATRGPEQIRSILESLARVELNDGLTLPQLVLEAENHMPRDATVIAILRHFDDGHVVALDDLKRRGYAVVAIINTHEWYDFADAAGPLVAAGLPVHHLRDEASISSVCRRMAEVGVRMG